MPLVRITLGKGKSAEYIRAIADGIHEAMVATICVPEQDRFQIIDEKEPEHLIADPSYLEITRTEEIVIVQITMAAGRTIAQKQALYHRIATNLEANPGLRVEDVMIVVTENGLPDWSFGKGEAPFALRSFEEIRGDR